MIPHYPVLICRHLHCATRKAKAARLQNASNIRQERLDRVQRGQCRWPVVSAREELRSSG